MTAHSSTIGLRTVNLGEAQALAATFTDLAYTQDPGYAVEAAARVGAAVRFIALDDETGPVGFAAVRLKRLPVIGGGLAYLHGGPAVRLRDETERPGLIDACVAALARDCAAQQLTLRVSLPGPPPASAAMPAPGFRAAGVGGETIVLDLAPPLAALRAGLAGKWRTDLNRGERGDLRIERSADPAAIARLAPLLGSLAARKGFAVAQDADFFARTAAHARPEAKPFVAHLAYNGDELVAGHIGAYTGDTAVYLLGAASAAGREARAALVLQWAVIEYAQARGLARYDLGGIDRAANPDVYRFKARMGGTEMTRPDWWEMRSGTLRPALIALAERIRR